MSSRMFHISTEEEIKKGKTSDVYFYRAREILQAEGVDKRVRAEFVLKKFPESWKWGVLAGIEECACLLTGLGASVDSLEEGTIFATGQPVMTIEGRYLDFGIYETALLGLLCQASGIATKAARCKKAAEGRPVISFGARRMHPALAPMIERSAYIGGCDGVAAVVSADLLGIEPSGTMPHAPVLLMGDTVKAAVAFHRVIDPKVARVALIDTFGDEKFEAIEVAAALGTSLYGVRLDTPSSRRGDMVALLREVRWELDLRGYDYVRLFVSGGLDEKEISELNPAADAYGVGTAISNAPVLDFAMDVVEIEGRPIAKRGKLSGGKRLLRCTDCFRTAVVPEKARVAACPCGGSYEDILKPLIRDGAVVRELKRPGQIRAHVLEQLKRYEP